MIQVLDLSLDMLEMLAQAEHPMRTTDIAKALDLSLQRTNNILRTLHRRKYVSQDEHLCYRLGGQCWKLGCSADRWADLRAGAEKPMLELSRKTGSVIFLGIMESDRLFCVTSCREGRIMEIGNQQWADELHSTASGRILLANLPQQQRIRVLARLKRGKLTSSTVTDPAELDRILDRVLKDGYAEVCGESRDQVASLAIPFISREGICCALAFSDRMEKYRELSLAEKLELLKSTAEKMETNEIKIEQSIQKKEKRI